MAPPMAESHTVVYFPGCAPQPELAAVVNGTPRHAPESIDDRTDEFFDPELPGVVNKLINHAIAYRDATRIPGASETAEHHNHGALFVVAPEASYGVPIDGKYARYSRPYDTRTNLSRVRAVLRTAVAVEPGSGAHAFSRVLETVAQRDWEIDGAYLFASDGRLYDYGVHLQVMQGELDALHPELEGGARTRAAAYTAATLPGSDLVMLSSGGKITYWRGDKMRVVDEG